MEILMLLAVVAAIVSVFGLPVLAGVWILRPLDLAAKRYRRPTRFSILDFFGLVFLVQMPMALIHALVPDSEALIYWAFLITGWLVSAAVWAMAVKTFSNAGIQNVWTRAVLVFFVLPMAYFATFAVVIVVIAAINRPPSNSGQWLMYIGAEILLLLGIAAAGALSRYVAPEGWKTGFGSPFTEHSATAGTIVAPRIIDSQIAESQVVDAEFVVPPSQPPSDAGDLYCGMDD